MRLINADTLKKLIMPLGLSLTNKRNIINIIDDLPTIDFDTVPIQGGWHQENNIKHSTCVYKCDHIYLDPANYNLYTLFLHCELCGKPIKLVVKTENDIVNWLGGVR